MVVFDGRTLADTRRARRVLETSHPPVYYVPPEDVDMTMLDPTQGTTWCEWKGESSFFDVVTENRIAPSAAWTYRFPHADFEEIAGHIAFYARSMDSCTVDGEEVVPQPGGFYGGWITSDVSGPFKGEPGTRSW